MTTVATLIHELRKYPADATVILDVDVVEPTDADRIVAPVFGIRVNTSSPDCLHFDVWKSFVGTDDGAVVIGTMAMTSTVTGSGGAKP